MTVPISRLYDKYSDARAAVQGLEAAGVPHADITLVANNSEGWYKIDEHVDTRALSAIVNPEGTGVAGVGGEGELLASLGLLAIPGLGPVVVAGWLAATAADATTGGVVDALTEAGVSREDAPRYAEGVRRGGTLVSARIPEQDRARLDAILDRSAVDLRDRSAAWQKSGWKTFDPASKPYDADEVRRERQLYGPVMRG